MRGDLESADHTDLLSNFLQAKNSDGSPMSIEDVKAETLLVLIGGADTTATAIQAIVYHVLKTPGVYSKLTSEIAHAESAGLLSPIVRQEETLAHLPYYVAVVRETMRLTPSLPNLFPRSSKGGLTVCGQYVPDGFEITCNSWTCGRNRALYGEDAELFRPERWLEDPERAKQFEKYDFAFGYMTRSCLGKSIALMELYKAPLQLFRTFELEFVNKEVPARFYTMGGVLRSHDMDVQLRRRPGAVVDFGDL